MSAGKRKAPNLLLEAASTKAKPWAAWTLAMALLACLTAWGTREYQLRVQIRETKEAATSMTERAKSNEASASLLLKQNRELSSKLETAQRSSSSIRRGKTTKGADGSETSEWEDTQIFLEQVLTASQTEKDEAVQRAVRAEKELAQEKLASTVLRSELVSLREETVTHTGLRPIAGLLYDLGSLGDPAAPDGSQRLHLEGGMRWSSFDAALSIKPGELLRGPEGEDWREKLKRLGPMIRSSMAF